MVTWPPMDDGHVPPKSCSRDHVTTIHLLFPARSLGGREPTDHGHVTPRIMVAWSCDHHWPAVFSMVMSWTGPRGPWSPDHTWTMVICDPKSHGHVTTIHRYFDHGHVVGGTHGQWSREHPWVVTWLRESCSRDHVTTIDPLFPAWSRGGRDPTYNGHVTTHGRWSRDSSSHGHVTMWPTLTRYFHHAHVVDGTPGTTVTWPPMGDGPVIPGIMVTWPCDHHWPAVSSMVRHGAHTPHAIRCPTPHISYRWKKKGAEPFPNR